MSSHHRTTNLSIPHITPAFWTHFHARCRLLSRYGAAVSRISPLYRWWRWNRELNTSEYLTRCRRSDNGALAVRFSSFPARERERGEKQAVNHSGPATHGVSSESRGNETPGGACTGGERFSRVFPSPVPLTARAGPKSFQASLPTSLLSSHIEMVTPRCPLCIWMKSFLLDDK